MAAVKPKVLTYAVAVDRAGGLSAEDEPGVVQLDDHWTPDHLLLAAVVRCSIASLEFHARNAHIGVEARGEARGVVTIPDGEGRFRFVEIDAELDVELDPLPDAETLAGLLERAERDCFVGASLIAKPRYEWRVRAR